MPGRRPLLLLLALYACAAPACLHISARVDPEPKTTPEKAADVAAKAKTAAVAPPPQPRTEFSVLPKAPGAVVATKPDAPATTTSNTAQKPVTPGPAGGVKPAGGEPAAFPLLSGAALAPEPPLLAAVRAYSEGRPDQAIEVIRRMDKGQQELVLAVLPILARGATADLVNDPATAAALVDQLRTAADRLEPQAALQIEKAVICRDVEEFGRFVPRPLADHFKPNERVRLYLEVRNLGSQPAADGFVTGYRAAAEVRDAEGKVMAQIDPKDNHRVPVVRYDRQLASRSPLRDVYVLYSFAAPPTPGVYTITYQLSDASGRRTVKSPPVEFHVAGP